MSNKNTEQATAPVYNELQEIAELNHVSPDGECAISNLVIGKRLEWQHLEKADAVKLLTEIQINGIDELQNKALSAGGRDSKTGLEPASGKTGATPVSHITDEETGEVVEVTREMRDEALQAHGQVEGAFWQLATALARIKNERLYLALDYNSFKSYCVDTLPFGVRSAYRYALVGENIGQKLLNGDSDSEGVSKSLEKAGVRKLHLLASKAEDQINELIESGKITIGDEELSAAELKDRRVDELKQMLKNANEKAQRAELLEEQKANVEMQRDSLEEKKEALEEWKSEHQERAEKQDEIEQILSDIAQHKEDIQVAVNKLDPELMMNVARDEQMEKLVLFLDGWQQSATRQKHRHMAMIEAIHDESFETDYEGLLD